VTFATDESAFGTFRTWPVRQTMSAADIVAGTRETYDGPLQVGEDLMCFEIGDTVIVRPRRP
jgi:hypothetical protein